ncbi:hypothetical protein ACJX0J_029281, partial [Zea mays]
MHTPFSLSYYMFGYVMHITLTSMVKGDSWLLAKESGLDILEGIPGRDNTCNQREDHTQHSITHEAKELEE